MPIYIQWGTPESDFVLVKLIDFWNWADYQHAAEEAHLLFSTIGRPVPLVIDLTRCTTLPLGAFSQIPGAIQYDHPNRGELIFMGANTVLQGMGQILRQMYPNYSKSSRSAESQSQVLKLLKLNEY